jgi:hypothetical protein
MLGTIRSRVLSLATDLERINPDAGSSPGLSAIPQKAMQQITAHVYGGQLSFVAPMGDLMAGSESVVGSTPGRDISTGGEQAHTSIRDSSIESREKSWFARHPWVSGIIIGLATGVLPAIYIAVWGLHLP